MSRFTRPASATVVSLSETLSIALADALTQVHETLKALTLILTLMGALALGEEKETSHEDAIRATAPGPEARDPDGPEGGAIIWRGDHLRCDGCVYVRCLRIEGGMNLNCLPLNFHWRSPLEPPSTSLCKNWTSQ